MSIRTCEICDCELDGDWQDEVCLKCQGELKSALQSLAQEDTADTEMQQFLDKALADVDGWTE